MGKVRLGIVGVGNCASSLLQGIEYYRDSEGPNQGKVGKPLEVAALALPNCTQELYPKLPNYKLRVEMGPILDGFSEHMLQYPPEQRFVPSDAPAVDVAQ